MISILTVSCGPPILKRFDPVASGLKSEKIGWKGGEVQSYASGADRVGRTTVIFVHGSPGSASGWSRYLEDDDLKDRFHLVAYDRPGYAGSGLPWKPLGEQIEALVELIKKQKGDVILVGHSLGGPVVLGASAEYGRKISQTLVLAGSVDPSRGPTRPMNAFLKYSFLQYALPEALRVSNEEVHGLRPGLEELSGELGRIRNPVTVIQGKKDKLVPYENVNYLQDKLTGVEPKIILLENEGHFLPWRQYELVKGELLKVE